MGPRLADGASPIASSIVIPAKAGIFLRSVRIEIPTFAGMTKKWRLFQTPDEERGAPKDAPISRWDL